MMPILSDMFRSRRCSTKNALFFLLMILVVLVSGQDYTEADLESMTEAELESICVQRGFQLVNENSDELTKQDYIEAAQRCLAIEQEMNELLTQYPELAEELEEEIKRMEKENTEKQADVERLQNEIGNDSTSDPGTAFVRPGKSVEEEDDQIIPDEATGDFKAPDDSFESSSTMDLDDDTLSEEETDAVETIESPTKEDLTLTHIAVESLRVLIKNAKDDVRRIINLTLPVLQPIFDAGDIAWRQMKDLFVKARKAYEAYQTTSSMTSDEATETAETCDDAAYA
mmetsp:Transcript_1420/g.3264  ORF Transcript_1420/g.3264 Transcript_1420/m.3264 type:complete len:285 (-) Transcript_1420:42-896(-)